MKISINKAKKTLLGNRRKGYTLPTNNKLYPVYYDGTDIRAMSATDVFDTFITQAIGMLVDGTDRGGTFRTVSYTHLRAHET